MKSRSKSPRQGRGKTKSPDEKKGYGGDGGSTFLTQTKQDASSAYTLHDMLFPGGILSKLVVPPFRNLSHLSLSSAKSRTPRANFSTLAIFSIDSNSTSHYP